LRHGCEVIIRMTNNDANSFYHGQQVSANRRFPQQNHRFQFRVEVYNWLNHPNWDGASTNPRSSNFGKVTGKDGNRELQFALAISSNLQHRISDSNQHMN
jgi:hypothetical protein